MSTTISLYCVVLLLALPSLAEAQLPNRAELDTFLQLAVEETKIPGLVGRRQAAGDLQRRCRSAERGW